MTAENHGVWLTELLQQKKRRQLALLAALHAPRGPSGEPLDEQDEAGDERPRDERGRFVAAPEPPAA